MKYKLLVLLLITLFLFVSLFAGDYSGGQPCAFLRIPVGARAGGLGNSFTAIADDISSLYWNPGGLFQFKTVTAGGMYSLMSQDRIHNYACLIIPVESSLTFALSGNQFGISDISGWDEYGNFTGKYDDLELAISLGVCKSIGKLLGLGFTVKYLNHSLQVEEAKGFGYDVGLLFNIGFDSKIFNSLRFGITAQDIGSSIEWDTESSTKEEIPLTMRIGCALDFKVKDEPLLITFDVSQTTDEEMISHAGIETWLFNLLALRCGLNDEKVNFGASFKIKAFQIDYAYCPDIFESEATNRFGVQISF